MREVCIYCSPAGLLELAARDGKLIRLKRCAGGAAGGAGAVGGAGAAGVPARGGVLAETVRQLDEYFAGKRRAFDIPVRLDGTPFQMRVWRALARIPYGETCSYGRIAAAAGNPKAARAAGGAIHRNPVAIIVPCHRVIGADGSLTGYAGGLDMKRILLALEQENR